MDRTDDFATKATAEFHALIAAPEFPCLGAKAALSAETVLFHTYETLGSDHDSRALARDLRDFLKSEAHARSDYVTFVAIFRGPSDLDEREFEALLWRELRKLNRIDAAAGAEWAPDVASNPEDPHFSYSFAGHAFYVIGMHAHSSREARRFRWPTLVFNLHEQFERLRADEKWNRMQERIREREIEFEGSVNPMLTDFGEASEARQYSGRAVGEEWEAPFTAEQDQDGESA
jgi:FPC/CPF motif-containing protein YcgG